MAFKFEFANEKTVELPSGEKITVREPDIQELRSFRKQHQEAEKDEEKQFDLTIEFLESLGFPAEYAVKTTDAKLLAFIQWLTSEKKN